MHDQTLEELRAWVARTPGAILEEHVPPNPLDPTQTKHAMHVILIGSEVILVESTRWVEPGTYIVGDDRCLYRDGERVPDGVPLLLAGLEGWLGYLNQDAMVLALVAINSRSEVFRTREWYVSPFNVVAASELGELLDEFYRRVSDYDKTHANEAIHADVKTAAAWSPERHAPLQPYSERAGFDPAETRAQFEALLNMLEAEPEPRRSRWGSHRDGRSMRGSMFVPWMKRVMAALGRSK